MGKKWIIFVFAVMVNIIAAQEIKEHVKEKIKNVENGLVEFTSPESIINPGKYDSPNKKSIETRMREFKVPGVSIAIVDDYKIVFSKGYGLTKSDSGIKVGTETIFEAASTSKLITSAIVIHYVQAGLLNLDEDVNKYLKRWKVPESEFTQKNKVTLRNLLTHKSGLPGTNFPYDEKSKMPTLLDVVKGESPAKNKPAVPVIEPGSKWQYSNVGYVLIQLILEDVIGKPFTKIADEIIFSPLKMKSSSFIYPLNYKFQKREAYPHTKDGKTGEPQMHPSAFAQGGLMTTPSDLARFTIELQKAYSGKSKIFNKNFAEILLHKESELDPKMFGLPVVEGLGVMLLNKQEDLLFFHPGNNSPGSICWLIASATKGKGAVVMINGEMGEILSLEIIMAIIKEFNW
jgi:CubicO group peptidase (beta-lactamase class C family)